jgi:hypothetical protein
MFVSHNIADKNLLASFSEHFETALIGSGSYRVLDRNTFERILAEGKNEGYVASINDLTPTTRKQLSSIAKAEGVIFGEVTDDVESGEIIITATLESFDSVKHWKRFVSMKRGVVHDDPSRRAAIQQLITACCLKSDASEVSIHKTIANDFLFDLVRCTRSDRRLTCEIDIVNNEEEDRDFGVVPQNARVLDENSFETRGSAAVVAGRTASAAFMYVKQTLLSGRPTKMTITFESVSSRATTIGKLELLCEEGQNREFRVVFRNVKMETAQ